MNGGAGWAMEVFASSTTMALPYTASSVAVARRQLMSDLSGTGVTEGTASDAVLILSELVSNALRHATPLPDETVKASWRIRLDIMEISVSDGGGPTVPSVAEPGGGWSVGGRGLGIVDHLALRWGVSDTGGEVTVWAELPVRYGPAESRLVTAGSAR